MRQSRSRAARLVIARLRKRGRRIAHNNPSALCLGCRPVAAGDGIVAETRSAACVHGDGSRLCRGDGGIAQRQRTTTGRSALISVQNCRGERHCGAAAADGRMQGCCSRCRNHQIVRIQIPFRCRCGGFASADYQQGNAVGREALRGVPGCRIGGRNRAGSGRG